MFSSRIMYFILITLIAIFSKTKCDPDTSFSVTTNNWKKIENVWPIQDLFDTKISEFFFINDVEKQFNWTFDKKFVDDLKDLNNEQTLKLTFKYWSAGENNEYPPRPLITIGKINLNGINTRYARYKLNEQPLWMPIELVLSKKQLSDFELVLKFYEKSGIVAIKDLKIEYYKVENGDGSKEFDVFPTLDPSQKSKYNFPKDCYAYSENYNPYCAFGFIYDLNAYNSTGREFKNVAEFDSCFNIKILSKIKSEVNVFLNGYGDQTMLKLKTYKPSISQNDAMFQNETLCISDFTYYRSGKFDITFSIKFNEEIKDKQIAIALEKSSKKPDLTTQYYLSEMKKELENDHKWSNEWLFNVSPNFQANESKIEFTARSYSNVVSSTSISSVWLEFYQENFKKDSQMTITTNSQKDFNSFVLKPKICTEFFHCIDVFITNLNEKGNTTSFDFNFDNKINSKFIKLVIEVDYFIPLYEETNIFDIKFSLKLTNFGNPCLVKNICGLNGICNANPLNSKETPTCTCLNGFTGDLCTEIDNCEKDGQKVCDKIAGFPDCKNSGTSFRCVCSDESNLNWNKTTQNCVPLIVGNDKSNWEVLDYQTFLLYPTNPSNYFNLNFAGIDRPQDLCLLISYVSKSNSMLKVTYKSESGATETIFDYFLEKNPGPDEDKTIEVCLNDFRFHFEDTFNLQMSISDLQTFTEDSFKIRSIETNYKIKKIDLENLLKKYDKSSDSFTNHWQILPNKIYGKDISNEFGLPINKNDFVTIRYISNWIKEDPYFGNPNSESYFKIDFGVKDAVNSAQINTKILYNTNEKLSKIIDLKAKKIDYSEKEFAYKLLEFPKDIFSYFRIIIDITMKPTSDQTFNIVLNSFSIGDPCFIDLGKNSYCKNFTNRPDTICIDNPTTPDPKKENICTCQGDSSGDKCQWKDLCDSTAMSYCRNYILDNDKECQQHSPLDYECSCPQKYFNREKKKCLIKKKFVKKVIECTGKSCPFMTSPNINLNWASKELPRLDPGVDKNTILPFYYTNKKDNLITFEFNAKDNTDICSDLKYSSTGNSNFSISYDKGYKSIKLPTTLRNNEIYSEQTICISDLNEPVVKNMKFNLNFEVNSDLSEIGVIRFDKSAVHPKQDTLKLLSALPYLVQYDPNFAEPKFQQKNQWPLRLPSKDSEWGDSNTFIFTTQYSGIRESILFSHWLEPNKDNIQFRTNISNINPLMVFEMDFLLYDNKLSATNLVPKMFFDAQKIVKNRGKEIVNIPISPQKTAFRFAIKVTYIDQLPNQNLFELIGTDIGDPCVIDGNIINKCSGQGTCKRNETGYTCECKTNPNTKLNFTGINCEITDYCKTPIALDDKKLGQDVCNDYKSNCTNLANGFKCICPDKETYWDVKDKKCSPIPKCLTHKCVDFEICGYDSHGNATCLCQEDYVRNNETNGKCELYDPCNQLHRLWKKPSEELNRCVLGGKCVALSKGKHSDWDCLCDPGYKKTKVKDDTTCTSIICDNKWMNKCQQMCEIDNTIKDHPYNCSCFENYIRDGDNCKFNSKFKKCEKCDTFDKYCDINGNCVCKPEFEEQSDKSCKMKIDESVCPTKNYTKDSSGNQYCDCGPFYDYNKAQSTCDLKPICAKGGRGRAKCDKQNKICTLNPKKEELFECVCPGNLNEDKTRDNKCVNNCVLENNFDKCASRNAICNPYKSIPNLCECPHGFEMTKPSEGEGICVVNEFSARFSLQFKNDYVFPKCKPFYDEKTKPVDLSSFTYDLNGFLKDSIEGEKLNRVIRESILSEQRIECFGEEILIEMKKLIPANSYKKDSMENKCSKLKSGDLSCTFSVVFTNEKEQKNTNIFNNLRDSCVPFGDNKECFILLDDPVKPYSSLTASAETHSKVILDYSSVKDTSLTSNKGCGEPTDKQNPCPRFSDCVQDKTNAYYNCTCNKEYFNPLKPVTNLLTATGPNQKYIIEKCEEKDICTQKCTTKNGNNCVQNATQINGGAWKVQYACNCLDPLMRNNVTACTAACSNIECKNGVNNIKAGICHCECNEGYYGEACKLESSTSKGGWIAGIVVLAVLVVILAGVAFMFARRSRNNSTEYSGRPMDDYTGSSYRVPPNQSRGQQNPSFTRE